MIVATAQVDDDGAFVLKIDGHADPSVCAAVTAFEQSSLIWLEQLALLAPGDVTFTLITTSEEDTPS